MSIPLLRIGAAFALLLAVSPAVALAQVGVTEPQDTIITSDGPLKMRNDGVEAYFVMTDNVHLVGTNLEVTCDKLEVFAETKKEEEKDAKGFGGIGGIRRILATGNVIITQEGRRAMAGRAEVIPEDGMITLTEDPVVTDPQGTLRGSKIEIFRGERYAVVHDPEAVFRSLPNLGFPRQPGDEASAAEPETVTPPESSTDAPASDPAPTNP